MLVREARGGEHDGMPRPRRAFQRFLEHPASLRYAIVAIISVTIAMVVIGAVVIRIFDPEEFPDIGEALWFTLQTVTTVGYGDITPADPVGRVVAALIMLCGIGFLTVITASITSLFIQAASKRVADESRDAASDSLSRIEASLESIAQRIERLEHGDAPADRDAE
jgi:voltage-gated potassium channel